MLLKVKSKTHLNASIIGLNFRCDLANGGGTEAPFAPTLIAPQTATCFYSF